MSEATALEGATRLNICGGEVGIVGQHPHLQPLATDARHPLPHLAQPNDAHCSPLGIAALEDLPVQPALLA